MGGVRLQDGDVLRFAVGGGGGGEHDLIHAVGHHGLQQHLGAAQVVVVVLQGLCHALPHQGVGREVDDPLDGLFLKEHVTEGPVPDIPLIETGLGVDRLHVAGLQVVRNHHIHTVVNQLIRCVGADVAGPAQYQDRHAAIPPVKFSAAGCFLPLLLL